MRIIGPASATLDKVRANLTAMGATPLFINDILPQVWVAAERQYLDPVGLVAQSYKETGGGKFGRATTPKHFNTCGLKNYDVTGQADDDPNAHAKFPPGWVVGAMAHAQHVRAYAGWPVSQFEVILSPRYVWVVGKYKLQNWSEFGGGRWAPSVTYGAEIEVLMARLQS
jgi:N-acetylmuramoyl-L-alanine amidase